jgi:2-polyprenyl-3-methyl-5-hydroxy-6-metoxy-1,4-benzoquinol methylase
VVTTRAGRGLERVEATVRAHGDIAGQQYWDEVWKSRASLAVPIDPENPAIGNYPHRRFHGEVLAPIFGGGAHGRAVIEIGCANSGWLPYFGAAFGWRVVGLDYSEVGCARARAVLERAGVPGTIVHGDVFAPPPELRGAFDVVFSWGVAEHFADTSSIVRAFAALLRPGGVVVTVVPNMHGAVGFLQKALNRAVFDKHVQLDPDALGRAHEAVGLSVERCEFFLSTCFSVVNPFPPYPSWSTPIRKLVIDNLGRLSKVVWVGELALGRSLPATRLLAPYVVCVARLGPSAGGEK